MGSSSKKSQITGFRYGFDIQMGLGLPLDEICAIEASGKLAWQGSITSNGQINIDAPNLFGGDKGEGGLHGTLDVMFGDEGQTPVAKLVSMLSQLGGIVPAFRGITTAFYSGLVTSNSPYPKAWKVLRRGGNRLWGTDGAWYPEKQFIWLAGGQIKAMNPAHILYLGYTSARLRANPVPRTRMDDAAWRAAADTFYAEQLGLCLEWKRSDSFKTFRDTVLDHISAEVFLDRRQALLSIRPLRDDYDVASLPLFDEDSGLLEITRDESSSNDGSAVPSIMVVKYTDAIDGETKQVKAVNSAVAARDGGQSVQTKEYPGAPTGEIAGRLCLRDLRLATSALKRFKIVLDRRGRDLSPGKPFRVRSLKRGIGEMVVRVGRYEDGTLVDGRITITALQDVFGLPATSFVGVPPAGWAPPDREPRAVTVRRVFEVPYRELAGTIDPANLSLLDVTETYLASVAQAPTSMSLSYSLTDRVGSSGSFVDRGTGDWCPTGLLVSSLPLGPGPSVVTLSSYSRLEDIVVGMAALVDDEIVRVDSINYTTATLTLARGCADTLPAQHAAGARVWFYDGFEAVDETSYTQGATLQAQLLTNTSSGQLAAGLAGTDSLTLVGRQGRPYPPGNLKANGQVIGNSAITGELTLSWSWRDRLQQADQLIDHTIGSIGPEAGVTVSLNVYGESDTLIKSVSGLSASSWNYPAADEAADAGLVSDADLAGYYSAVLADAPYAFYKLIDAGATAVDSGASARNGSYNNGAAGNQKIYGVVSGNFDGVNDYVQLPSTGFSDFVTNGISIFALFYPRSFAGAWQRIIDLSNQVSGSTASNNIIFSRYNNTSQLHFGWWNGSSTAPTIVGGTLTLNKWQLCGITITPARVAKLWINGQVVATSTLASMPNNINRTANYIVRSPFSADSQTNGAVAGVAIFDKAISDTRAAAYWDAMKNQINQGRLNTKLRIEAWAVRGSIASAQKYNVTLTR